MSVLVDTGIWSLALRRKKINRTEQQIVRQLQALILDGDACMTGVIRQEVLSGIKHQQQFEKLKLMLQAFDDMVVTQHDHELAADLFNTCRCQGVQGSHIDFLICAIAVNAGIPVFSIDGDFPQYAKIIPVKLYQPSVGANEVHDEPGDYG